MTLPLAQASIQIAMNTFYRLSRDDTMRAAQSTKNCVYIMRHTCYVHILDMSDAGAIMIIIRR